MLAVLGRPAVSPEADAERQVLAAYLDDPTATVYVAELDAAVVGVASLVVRPRLNWPTPEGWVADLVVHPGVRRRGVGTALLDACVTAARGHGCHLLRLDCGLSRAEAHALYEAYGFTRAGYDFQLRLKA